MGDVPVNGAVSVIGSVVVMVAVMGGSTGNTGIGSMRSIRRDRWCSL